MSGADDVYPSENMLGVTGTTNPLSRALMLIGLSFIKRTRMFNSQEIWSCVAYNKIGNSMARFG